MEKESVIEEPPLVRRIDPAQQAEQDHHERRDTKGIDLDDDRLAPHEAVVAEQHAGNKAGDHADGALPMARYRLEVFNAFHQETAPTRDQQAEQPRGQRASGGLAERHPPGDILERHQHRPKPGIEGPERIARRMRNARVIRARRQFTRVLERQLRGKGQVIADPDGGEGEQERQPINPAEEWRQVSRAFGRRRECRGGAHSGLGTKWPGRNRRPSVIRFGW